MSDGINNVDVEENLVFFHLPKTTDLTSDTSGSSCAEIKQFDHVHLEFMSLPSIPVQAQCYQYQVYHVTKEFSLERHQNQFTLRLHSCLFPCYNAILRAQPFFF